MTTLGALGSRPLELPLTRAEPRGRGLLHARVWQKVAKRALDIALSAAGLALLAPVLLVLAAGVVLSSPGPPLFVQQRVGTFGRLFPMLKFRSMYRDAEARLGALRDLNEVDGPVFKVRDDPRVTPFGRVLRRFSLDELPQLVNVLIGQMSLVGPRPPIADEVDQYRDVDFPRLLVKPGITCIWQVSGRSDVDFDTWMLMDRAYIENWTLRLDLLLILRTAGAVLRRDGAY